MPCWATIQLLEGLKTLDEIETALKEAKWEYTRTSDMITATNPYTQSTMTFRQEVGGVSLDNPKGGKGGPPDSAITNELRTWKKAREVKDALKRKGFKLKKQTREAKGIRIRLGG